MLGHCGRRHPASPRGRPYSQARATDIRLHDLRHTWATLAPRAGVSVKVVQERLGHANPSITMNIYAHALPGMQARAAEQVASLFG
ncbi:tyrosine-type recombinase/integrase [Nocardiopsis sp. CNR-923]|uniref:tyrosine-type recombinase/integrase n=1 Tax=Nocardiopsis sp. CNR-923 TaxID=1904965 RepID=UPI001651054B|nr:tyrosine-type recombinase/integrase [Nocardiopsis sp. CNR-923]